MKANLELLFRIWSQADSPLGNVLFEGDIGDEISSIFENVQNAPHSASPEYYINIQNEIISVFKNEDHGQHQLFTQEFRNRNQSHKTSRRYETLANQKKRTALDEEWAVLLEYLEDRECDWIFSLLIQPLTCDSTSFARIFGYNSFFHRWFSQILKRISKRSFNLWKDYFQGIYHDNNLKRELYWTHFYIILICTQIINILSKKKEMEDINLENSFPLLKSLNSQFFSHTLLENEKSFKMSMNKALNSVLFSHPPNEIEDILNLFYQELIAFSRRHTLGEFYTNVELSKEMVKSSYSIGDTVLDPCCGSGTFLLEVLNLLESINEKSVFRKLHGIDIHPISVIITKINLSIALLTLSTQRSDLVLNWKRDLEELLSNITQGDFLFEDTGKKYDLIIGNPPWIVINSINSENYKGNLKSLARSLRISTDTQNVSNLEVSSLFLEKCSAQHMKAGSKLFLIMSAGILNGSQNERVRRFSNLKQIKIWTFEKDLFNVHNICVKANYGSESIQKKYRIQVKFKDITENSQFVTKKTKIYTPVYIRSGGKFFSLQDVNIESKSDEWGIGRLIPEQKKTLTVKKSEYHSKFRQGACLGPRNLLFVISSPISTKESSICNIFPDPLIKSKKYGGWDYTAFSSAKIEKKYLHTIVKSTELIPFFVIRSNTAFLPLTQGFSYSPLLHSRKKPLSVEDLDEVFGNDSHAKSHYLFLHSLYANNIKSGGAISDLFLNMNYNNKLLQENQRMPQKVVYNGIGSKVKAAYIRREEIVDSSLYYFVPNSEMEAYYLVGVLNSPSITDFTNNMGSTGAGGSLRNIHKNPLKCNILQYKGTPTQKMIAKLGKSIETYVHKYCIDNIYEIFITALNKEFCSKCGEFFDSRSWIKHKSLCKRSLSMDQFKKTISSLTPTEKDILSDKDTISKLLLRDSLEISGSIKEKAQVFLNLVIKPKTIQNRLRKDELFIKKIKVLDLAVKSLWI